jgi:hypothetical protein
MIKKYKFIKGDFTMASKGVQLSGPDCERPMIPYTYHTFIDAHAHDAEVVFVDAKHVMFIAEAPQKDKGLTIDLFV